MSAEDDIDPQTVLDAQAQAPRRIPMQYVDPVAGTAVPGSMPVVMASESEIRRFSQTHNVCGECRFFEQGHLVKEIVKTKFAQALVKDYEWKLEHAYLGSEKVFFNDRKNAVGLCSAWGATATGSLHAACDQFRPHNGKIKREASRDELQVATEHHREARLLQNARIAAWRKANNLDTVER